MKTTRRYRRAFSLFLLICSLLSLNTGLSGQKPIEQTRPPVRLVLLIAVDQFRYDYLERFGDLFGQNGIKRLMHDGGSWADANYDHMPTYTAPGHATMMTGAWPAETGIIANNWPDRESGRRVSSVSDANAHLLGSANEAASSPRRLLASTLGDELRLRNGGRSKVIGVSMKDRSAILPVGRHANAAYWYSTQSGRMVSSDYYFNRLPDWVQRFNDARTADKYFGARWERSLPEAEYIKRAGPDAPSWENLPAGSAGLTASFPHVITGGSAEPNAAFYEALESSPFSNDLLLSFAEQAIENEQLGADDDTDVLTVSFSANDYVGHRFGPYSQEVMDMALNVDRDIGALLDFVDKRVGLRNTVVAFTADHGVAPVPEHAASVGLPGGRIDLAEVVRAVRNAIKARYNPKNVSPDPTADYILSYEENGRPREAFDNGNIYFNTAALMRDGVSLDEIETVAGKAATSVPGISRYFTRAQLERGAVWAGDPVARRVLHGFNPRRSGDVILVEEAYKYLGETVRSTHGSPYTYDTHVPLIIMGRGIRPGRYEQPATPADIAPTLAALLRVQPPSNAVGRILLEGLADGR
jgi:predicted AlkP superfamily pyrophosphatase or phosphodiesterase